MEEAKKMKCYKRLVYKQFVQVSGLCGPQRPEFICRNISRTFVELCMHEDVRINISSNTVFIGLTALGAY